jgi:hypothetical protein
MIHGPGLHDLLKLIGIAGNFTSLKQSLVGEGVLIALWAPGLNLILPGYGIFLRPNSLFGQYVETRGDSISTFQILIESLVASVMNLLSINLHWTGFRYRSTLATRE